MSRRRLALFAVLLSACGPGSYGELRDQLVHASCTWALRCGYSGAGERDSCRTELVLAQLHDAAADRAATGAVDVGGEISAHRFSYDSLNAQSCLDAVSSSPCDLVLAAQKRRRCDVVFAPHVEVGDPCWSTLECEGGTCDATGGCAGTCASFAALGSACGAGCDPTVAYCDGTCKLKKPKGAACATDEECAVGYPCSSGHCNDPVTLSVGDACGGADPCKAGTYCDPVTLLCAKQRERGLACDTALACKDGYACIGLTATSNGACGPWLDVGDACTDVGVTGCPASQTCESGTCTGPGAFAYAQERCTDRACADGLGCNIVEVCDWLRPLFGDCSGDAMNLCEPGLVCSMIGQDAGVAPGRCIPDGTPACFQPSESEDAGL